MLTRSRVAPTGSSRAIDAAVRAALTEALGIYDVDENALAALAPDLIVTQDLCEVCAVSLDDVRAAVARLANRGNVEIISLRPTRLEHVLSDVQRVAEAMHVPERGTALRRALEDRIEVIAARARRATRKPRVATLEWIEPIMLGGSWMPELIELAGGDAVGVRAGAPAPTISVTELAALKADVVLIKPCGFSMERTLQERELLERAVLPNTGDARVYLTDGNAFFNRPGPRLVESVEILAAAVHPERFADLREKHRNVLMELR